MTHPAGKLIPIGGHEARNPDDEAESENREQADFFDNGVLQEVLNEIKGPESRLIIIPAASEIPDEMIELYTDAFGMLGCREVDVIQIAAPEDTDRPEHLEKLRRADGVLFTGGDQAVLIEKLADSDFLALMTERYQNEPFVIAGTSAGAAAMASNMIKEGSGDESLLKGMVELQPGLGLLPSLIVDTHFAQRGRLPRLTDALLQRPGLLGLGLSEDTGVVITGGNCLRVIGSGSAFLLETKHVTESNYEEAAPADPVSLHNLQVHILSRGAQFTIDEQKTVPQGEAAETTA